MAIADEQDRRQPAGLDVGQLELLADRSQDRRQQPAIERIEQVGQEQDAEDDPGQAARDRPALGGDPHRRSRVRHCVSPGTRCVADLLGQVCAPESPLVPGRPPRRNRLQGGCRSPRRPRGPLARDVRNPRGQPGHASVRDENRSYASRAGSSSRLMRPAGEREAARTRTGEAFAHISPARERPRVPRRGRSSARLHAPAPGSTAKCRQGHLD